MAMDLTITIKALNQASDAIAKVQSQVEKLQAASGKTKALGDRMQKVGKAMTVGGSLPILGALGAATKSAIDFESAMGNVAKLANLDKGTKEFTELETSLLKMSRTTPISAKGLADIAAAGASLGIATKDLTGFVDTTAKMAVAFDMTAEEAGNAIAKLRNVYSLDAKGGVKETTALGDAINALGDNTAAKESDIVNAMTRIGGASRNFGFSAKQAAALSAAVISMGNAPEVAATAINSWLPSLQTASKQTPKFQAALKAMGLDAKQLEIDIGKNAPAAFQKFVGAIGKLPKAARAAALKDMFGSGSDASILAAMANDTTQLAKAFQMVEKIKPGGMMDTFSKNSQTTANQLQLLKNSVTEVGITIGAALLPPLNAAISAVKPMVQGFADFAKANPQITAIGVAIAAVVAAIGPVVMAIGGFISAIGTIAPVAAAVFGAVGAAIAAVGAPVILAGIAIAGAAALIIANWGKVSGFLSQVASKIMSVLTPIGQAMANAFSKFSEGFQKGIGPALPMIEGALSRIQAMLAGFGPLLSALAPAFQVAFTVLGTMLQNAGTTMAFIFQGMTMVIQNFAMSIGTVFGTVISVIVAMGSALNMVFTTIVMNVQMAMTTIITVFTQIGAMIAAAVASISASLASLGAIMSSTFASMQAAAMSAISGIVSAITSGFAQAVAAVQSAGAAMVGAIQGIAGQMFAAGAAIVQQLIAGIQSQIGAAQAAIANLAGAIRGALPFSPAKWGPLSDIDKTGYGLVSTFARGIVPGPLMSALSGALTPVAGMMNSPMGGTGGVGVGMPAPVAAAGGGGTVINLTYSPQIGGVGGGMAEGDIRQMLQENARELVQLLQNEQRRLERTQYVPGGSLI